MSDNTPEQSLKLAFAKLNQGDQKSINDALIKAAGLQESYNALCYSPKIANLRFAESVIFREIIKNKGFDWVQKNAQQQIETFSKNPIEPLAPLDRAKLTSDNPVKEPLATPDTAKPSSKAAEPQSTSQRAPSQFTKESPDSKITEQQLADTIIKELSMKLALYKSNHGPNPGYKNSDIVNLQAHLNTQITLRKNVREALHNPHIQDNPAAQKVLNAMIERELNAQKVSNKSSIKELNELNSKAPISPKAMKKLGIVPPKQTKNLGLNSSNRPIVGLNPNPSSKGTGSFKKRMSNITESIKSKFSPKPK